MILMAANTLSRSKRPVAVTLAVTQRSSARYRHWPFRCCSSPVTVLAARLLPAPLAVLAGAPLPVDRDELFTDYRRPLKTFKSSFVRASIGLYFFKESFA